MELMRAAGIPTMRRMKGNVIPDVVNIGFVINVIESLTERVEALQGAYLHARGVMSVAAMLSQLQFRLMGAHSGDGYISSRNTFQKYFTQSQLRDFIEQSLDESAIAVRPGVFLVFRDKELEQRFLSKRYGHRIQTVLSRGWIHERQKYPKPARIDKASKVYEENQKSRGALVSLFGTWQAANTERNIYRIVSVSFPNESARCQRHCDLLRAGST